MKHQIFDQKMIGLRYQKDGHAQLFVIFRYTNFYSPTGNFELRETEKLDFQEDYTVNVNIFKTNVFWNKGTSSNPTEVL